MYFYILYNPTVVAHVHIIVYDTLGSVVPFMYQLYIYMCVYVFIYFSLYCVLVIEIHQPETRLDLGIVTPTSTFRVTLW